MENIEIRYLMTILVELLETRRVSEELTKDIGIALSLLTDELSKRRLDKASS